MICALHSWGLIEMFAQRKTPIDFFSWHGYTALVGLYGRIASAVRAKLDAAGKWLSGTLPCLALPALGCIKVYVSG